MQNWEKIKHEQANNPFYVSWMDGSELGFRIQDVWCDTIRVHGCNTVLDQYGRDWIHTNDDVTVEREVFAVTNERVSWN